tara:strand:- start:176 stop:427 length:252 start_codon:yes stop_codon:yes gene_type:complete
MGKGIKNRGSQIHKVKTKYSRKVRQPNPISEGWEAYRELVDAHVKKNHVMVGYPDFKCLTHKDCHLDSFYPGKFYRKMGTNKK